MYGEIFAKSELNDSGSGKTMRVWSDTDKLDFSVDLAKNLFIINARCYESIGTGEQGGFIQEIRRTFHLELEKSEVEKMVTSAVTGKLLKQLGITNLQIIDKSSSLELEIDKLTNELKSAHAEIKRLEGKIVNARKELDV